MRIPRVSPPTPRRGRFPYCKSLVRVTRQSYKARLTQEFPELAYPLLDTIRRVASDVY